MLKQHFQQYGATAMEIVELTMAHHDAVNQLSRKAGLNPVFDERAKENTERFLSHHSGFNFVALDWNRVVGYVIGACYVIGAYNKQIASLNNFGVEKSYHSNQIASKLLERFSFGLKARGVTHLEVCTKDGGSHREKYKFSDLGTLKMFDHLTTLHIAPVSSNGSSTDLRSLADLPQLSKLILERCHPQDYSPLSALTQLTDLIIESSYCEGFQFLSHLTQLTHLKLRGTLLSDSELELVSNLSKLTHLDIGACSRITDLSPLTQLQNLRELILHINENIKDFSPIGQMSNLRLVHLLEMRENLSEITFLRSLPHLTDLSITARNNLVKLGVPACGLSPISDLTNLTRLDLSYNSIRDISFLLPLSKLTYLNLKGNKIQDLSPIDALRQQSLRECITRDDYADQDWSLHGQDPGLQGNYS
ncbi:MAG: leucine-rich repeat domain-containing protein [Actinomycetota bacterium]